VDDRSRHTNIHNVQGFVQGDQAQVTMHIHQELREHSLSRQELQNRQRMLAKVRAIWITGVLEKSLHGAALLALGLEELLKTV
jgi:hypothetical protein